jgi:lipopolysaccharide transport system permease protein
MTAQTEDSRLLAPIDLGDDQRDHANVAVLIIEPGMVAKNYWRDLWHYRELLYFLSWRDIAVRYKQTAIGIAWALLRPALTMLVFVAFRRLVGLPAGAVPDPILVFAAVLPWQFFSGALAESAGSLIHNANLISKIYFPRLLIPVSAVMTSLVDFAITLGLLGILMIWFNFVPGWQIVALPLFVLLTFALALGYGLLLAALNVEYRDFRYVVPFIVQFGVYVSPIAFVTSDVPQQWRMIYALNPLVGIIDGFRWSILGGRVSLDAGAVSVSVAMTLSVVTLGLWYFRRMEHSFADVI